MGYQHSEVVELKDLVKVLQGENALMKQKAGK